MKQAIALLCAAVLTTQTAGAWNHTGHRAIAFMTYSLLNEKARQRVGEILRVHPDYATFFAKGTSTRPADVARNAFVTASTWPDIIRGDPRFTDDGSGPVARGFEDSSRHADWHFVNTPWPAEFSSQPIAPVNAVTQIRALLAQIQSSNGRGSGEAAYALPWLLHIVSDLHQPLHAVVRFEMRNGKAIHDRGGNSCYVEPGRNLHALWDAALGREDSEGGVARLAVSLMDQAFFASKPAVNPEVWVQEAVQLAPVIYAVSNCSDRESPQRVPAGYLEKAEEISRARAILAAQRLAAILNQHLSN